MSRVACVDWPGKLAEPEVVTSIGNVMNPSLPGLLFEVRRMVIRAQAKDDSRAKESNHRLLSPKGAPHHSLGSGAQAKRGATQP